MLITIILQLILLINITLIGGILPLIERKYLSLIQRRVGPKFVGYKGRLQFLADALKMFLKKQQLPLNINSKLFYFGPIFFLSLIYLLYLFTPYNSRFLHIDIEYQLIFIPIINLYISLTSFFVGFFSKNKYAAISSMRLVLVIICGELTTTSLYLLIICYNRSFSFNYLGVFQEEYILLFSVVMKISLILLILLIEVAKSPFDLVEAETELVTGFHTEYGSFFFALFYLGEYLHIFFSSSIILFCFTGLI